MIGIIPFLQWSESVFPYESVRVIFRQSLTEGLISSDLKLIANNAALKALQESALISMALLVEETSRFKPSLSQADLDRYLAFEAYRRD